jgi:methylmalonyl-CoA mutase cobalamin-binding subunit
MPRSVDAPEQKAAMVVCVPGETHTLGARMATDLLREQGWRVDMQLSLDHDDLVAKVVESGHVIIGVSAAGEHALPELARLVLAIRVSRPNAAILVSGNIVGAARDRITLMGVDGMSETFAEASSLLDQMWAKVSNPAEP